MSATSLYELVKKLVKLAFRGGSRRVAKFLSESNTFHIKSKTIKIAPL